MRAIRLFGQGVCSSWILFVVLMIPAFAVDELEPLVSSMEQAKQGMTLWQLIQSGGWSMVVLGLISIAAVTIILYCFQILKPSILVPADHADEILKRLDKNQDKSVIEFCEQNPSLVSRVTLAGLSRKVRGPVPAREAVEQAVRKEIGQLWQLISYLSDIASVAPLVGLLGTVLGMIQAFNTIAFQSAVVKPILLAGGVSKAMVTTAGGLILAIPVMLFYSFFRGKVQEVANRIEVYATDVIKTIEDNS